MVVIIVRYVARELRELSNLIRKLADAMRNT